MSNVTTMTRATRRTDIELISSVSLSVSVLDSSLVIVVVVAVSLRGRGLLT